MKKIILILLVLCFILSLPAVSLAGTAFDIEEYDVQIVVNENATYQVSEAIHADYHTPSLGMYRTIDLRPEVTIEHNGQQLTERYIVYVDDAKVVGEPYSTYTEDGMFVIETGNDTDYITGPHTHNISFLYDAGDDGYDDFDQFYYGIIGNESVVPIEHVTFSITMPKEFDAAQVGFSVGYKGVSGYDPDLLKYAVEGNVISGTYAGTLAPGQGITIRMELPQGYFVGARQKASFEEPALIVVGCITAVAFVLFLIFRRKKMPVVTVEFDPPEGMNSADVGYIVDGQSDDKDVVSLLIYWADQGYLTIHETDKKKVMLLKKVGDLPPDANDYESLMFDELFRGRSEVKTSDLEETFYSTVSAVKTRIGLKFKKEQNRVFVPLSITLRGLLCFFSTLPLTILALAAVYSEEGDFFTALVPALFVFVFVWLVHRWFIRLADTWESEKKSSKVSSLVFWIIIEAVINVVAILACVMLFEVFPATFWIPPVCGIAILLMAACMRRRTDQGLAWMGRILGLKNFIVKVEKPKLEMLVKETPEYFYHVLPYAYVLGVSDTWAKQFESITVEPPTWYYGGSMSTFSTIYFTSALMSSMRYTQASMISRPQSSGGGGGFGGGGFSGGGFSGGGFGGGGVGSR